MTNAATWMGIFGRKKTCLQTIRKLNYLVAIGSPVNMQWWSRFKMHTLQVSQCHARGGAIASHTAHNFHNFGLAFAGRSICSPNILVLHIITATILLPMLNKMNVPSAKFIQYTMELVDMNSGSTMDNSNQYVIGTAMARNSVVPASLSERGRKNFRTLIVSRVQSMNEWHSLFGSPLVAHLNFLWFKNRLF